MLIYFISVCLILQICSSQAADGRGEIKAAEQGRKYSQQYRVRFAEEDREVLKRRIETLERASRGDQISHTLQAQEIRRLCTVVEGYEKAMTRLSQTLDFKNGLIGRLQQKSREQQKVIEELTSRLAIVGQQP